MSAAVLVTELALTRIFSVTMFYHFAFLAVSVALFGLSASGVFVYVTPRFHAPERLMPQLARSAMLFSVVTIAAMVLLLQIHVGMEYSTTNLWLLLSIYLIATAPFFAAGECLALAISRLHGDINRVYAADLSGAALGCLLLVPALDLFGGPGALILAAGLGALASLLFAGGPRRRIAAGALTVTALLLAMQARFTVFDVRSVKGYATTASPLLFSKWNSFSRIAVYDQTHHDWGLSETYTGPHPDSRYMDIDNSASTPILGAAHGRSDLNYLRYELTGLAYSIKPNAHVLVIGPGGGRDLWTALVFGARRIEGVEINPIIVRDVMRRAFRAFSGDVYNGPGVSVVVDDGRSYIRRSAERYDVIQASLVDTWAASSAGAYALTENNLYTVEAFVDYLRHLRPDGMLTMSRWYGDGFRLVSLARAAAERLGWGGVTDRLFIARNGNLATFILKNSPLTPQEIATLVEACRRLRFDLVYAPNTPLEPSDYTRLATARDPERFYRGHEFDVSPTTDDRPFFFYSPPQQHPFRIDWGARMLFGDGRTTLLTVLVIAAGLVALFIVLPLAWFGRARGGDDMRGAFPAATLAYFGCLGAGFMLIEIGLMQRFVLFLGHPVYSITVVLFTLLLGGGMGSALTRRFAAAPGRALTFALPGVMAAGAAYGFLLPRVFDALIVLPLGERMLISVALLLPLGVLLGVPLPAGIRIAGNRAPAMVAWAWGINGATSVLGASVAIFLAMNWGFLRVALCGSAVYGVAAIIALTAWREPTPDSAPSTSRRHSLTPSAPVQELQSAESGTSRLPTS